jgi:DNA mismatch endonuclease (patch repair protein)
MALQIRPALAMTDTLTKRQRSARMRLIRSQDTKPERTVRRLVSALGFRYRLHRRDLPGCPDLVLPATAKAIFVHGCFWHLHTNCRAARLPKSAKKYWLPKLAGNRLRDRSAGRKLRAMGWRVLTIWECQTKNEGKLMARLSRFLGHG